MSPGLAGVVAGIGCVLVAAGVRRVAVRLPRPPSPRQVSRRVWVRGGALPVVAASAVLLFTRSPLIAILAAGLAAALGAVARADRARREWVEMVEALAEWAESLAALRRVGRELGQAVAATAKEASGPLGRHLQQLAAEYPVDPVGALRRFQVRLADGYADRLVNLLAAGALGRAGRLGDALGIQVATMRADVEAIRQAESNRSGERSQGRQIAGLAVLTLVPLAVVSRDFTRVFAEGDGRLWLGVLGAVFIACIWAIALMGRPRRLRRCIARRDGAGG